MMLNASRTICSARRVVPFLVSDQREVKLILTAFGQR